MRSVLCVGIGWRGGRSLHLCLLSCLPWEYNWKFQQKQLAGIDCSALNSSVSSPEVWELSACLRKIPVAVRELSASLRKVRPESGNSSLHFSKFTRSVGTLSLSSENTGCSQGTLRLPSEGSPKVWELFEALGELCTKREYSQNCRTVRPVF